MSDQELVKNIIKLSGGKGNIRNANNCMTRLRLELVDGSVFDVKKIESLDGVLSVVYDREAFPEIVLGPGRCRKCAEICRSELNDIQNNETKVLNDWKSNKEKVKSSQKSNPIKNTLKTFGEVFVPLIPGSVVAGVCAGIAMLISQCIPGYKDIKVLSIIYQILSLINISFMTYINAWVGYRTAEKFNATPILGGMIGMITNLDGINEIAKIIGFWNDDAPLASILRVGKGGLFAVFITVVLLSYVEKWIRKHMPENLDTIFSPLITLFVCATIHIVLIMPAMGFVSTFICDVVELGVLSDNVFIRIIVGYLSALLFLPLVAMGMHHGLIAIYSIQLAKIGFVTLYPSLAMAGAGQVGAAIAIYILAKKVNNKQICKVISGALPAGILGIGEPLIYGVTLPLGKPFITAGLGAGFGGAFMMLKQVASTTWGPSGILAVFIMTAGPNKAAMSMLYYVIGLLISIIMSFIITNVLYSEKDLNGEESNENAAPKVVAEVKPKTEQKIVYNGSNKIMKNLKGKSATTGIVIGNIVLWNNNVIVKERKISNVLDEIKRFDDAFKTVLSQMNESISKADEKTAEIIEARKMILDDKSFIDAIKNKINEGFSAEFAAQVIGKEKMAEFEAMESEYLRARSLDIKDISNKLISVLCNASNKKDICKPSIIFADEITPEDITGADREKVLGFVTKNGAVTSHASIVASNLGIPYIFGIDLSNERIEECDVAIIDADNATLILYPDKKTIDEYNTKKEEEEKTKANDILFNENTDKILKEHGISVYANIAGPEDVDSAIENGALGIGLYRTEFLYMKKDTVPTEEEQFESYKIVAQKMEGKEVIIRTMDIGADKEAKCLNLSHEENPALGMRAIRICLDNTELFRTQLRALLRAAMYGNVKIMFPMIANEKEIDEIKEQIDIAKDELEERKENYKIPPIGIMIETPAAAILSEKLAKKVDFFSIGTNDLTQYTLAVDRTGKNLDRYYRADDEAVLKLIAITIDGAKKAGIPVGICGEIASNVNIIPKLIEIGAKELSMAPSKISKAKQKIVSFVNNEKVIDINTNTNLELLSPVDGEIIPMEKIPDEAFSSGGLGRCIGINPENGYIYAPCDGVITTIATTKHAVGISTSDGKEILIHIGIDTVELKGEGFDTKVKESESIKKGDLLIEADIDIIKNANLSPIVIIAITKE